jgi:HSP20 family protein
MAETKGTSSRQQTTTQSEQEHIGRQSGQLQPRSQRGLERGGFSDFSGGSPWQFMRRMTEEMDRAFDRMFDDFGFGQRTLGRRGFFNTPASRESIWTPRIEAIQKDDKFIVRAELPGLKKDDVEVNVTEDALTIRGQRQHEQQEEREGFYHSERSYGSFYRTIPLPDGVIADSAEATFKDGVLEVRLQAPPNEVTRGRRVEISEGSTERKPQR